MAISWGFTSTGFIRPTMQELKDHLIGSYLTRVPDADFTTGSILDIQITAEAEVKAKQYADLERAIEESYLNSSNGIYVDRNVKPLGKARKQPTHASSKVQFKGTIGKEILRGVAVKTVSGLIYRTIEAGTITTQEGIVLSVIAEQAGTKYNIPIGAINTLVVTDTDVTYVSNVEPAGGGLDREMDYELKDRVYQGFIGAENKPAEIINFEIKDIDGVTSSVVLENKEESWQGAVGPHSLLAVVEGGEDAAIFKVLFDFLPFGVQTKTNVTNNKVSKIVSEGANVYELTFLRPSYVTFDVKIEVVASVPLTEAEKYEVTTLVSDIYSNLEINEDIAPRDIFKLLGDVINYNSVKVSLKKQGTSEWVDVIDILATELGALGEVTIIG
ncbi:MAG: baseplate J/gp47 family protein [Cellulosilyticaceae bacterium]